MDVAILCVFLTVFLNNVVPKLLSLAENNYKLYKGFKGDVTFLTKEISYIIKAIDGQLMGQDDPLHLSVEEFRRVAHEITDCIDRVMYRACRKELGIATVESGKKTKKKELAKEMRRLKTDIEDALKRKQNYCVSPHSTANLAQPSSDRLVPREEQFGLEASMEELLEPLSEAEPEQLKVITIVGFCGLGKTLLAHELYNSDVVGRQFKARAWVSAAHGDPRELLTGILRELQKEKVVTSDSRQLSSDIRKHLNNKRYFIVIDDMRRDLWSTIKSAFPTHIRSRVVVTTRFQSVAATCSTNGYVHEIGRLSQEHSKQLFLNKACPLEYLNYMQPDSAPILKQCDGQPLALATVGEFMRKKDWPKGPDCEDVCKQVRYHLQTDDTLNRMYQTLIHDYNSLPNHDLKACMLYFAMFPSDHPVRTKRLMRWWLAEGFVKQLNSGSDPAVENFKKLMDQNIIQPIDVSNNSNVKTCKTYGMMHEYIMLKSLSENIIALFDDNGKLQPKNARRLSLRDSSITNARDLEFDLSLVRSLIVNGEAGKAMLDFSKYQLLRVLDLEQCTDLQNDNLKEVCHLLLLKYLSLGGKVNSIPKDIKNLKLLETLDLRRTAVKIVPPEVVQLPNLVHLFGKFKLPNKVVQSELKKFIALGQSKLQTLAGFLVDDGEGFAELMVHMNRLRKVKIWCESSAKGTSMTNLQKAIQRFIHDVKDPADDPRSLSIHFEGCSEELLEGLKGPCYLRSLKLQGSLLQLPEFVTALRQLRELCLQSTKLTANLLTALGNLKHLQYLKLIADELDQITIRVGALPRLLRLCFVLKHPTFPKIDEGAMPFLLSLQLLCKDMNGLSGIQIKGFTRLREVILDDKVTSDTKANWVGAVKEHQNRPKVLLLKRANQLKGDRGEDYAASGTTENEITECPVLSEGPVQYTDIRIPPEELKSALNNNKGHPVICATSSDLAIAGNAMVSSSF